MGILRFSVMLSRVVGQFLVFVLVLVCYGCSLGGSHDDLRAFITEVKGRPQGAIEPLPPLRTYDAYIYNVTAMRSPFNQPEEAIDRPEPGDPKIAPDFRREKEYLESFNLDSLEMVGTLQQDGAFWALIKDAEGAINRATTGEYMGKDHGKIVAATATQIDLIEIVSDGLGGWLQRPRTLKLSEKE